MDINLESLAGKQYFYRRELGLDLLVLLHQGKRTFRSYLLLITLGKMLIAKRKLPKTFYHRLHRFTQKTVVRFT